MLFDVNTIETIECDVDLLDFSQLEYLLHDTCETETNDVQDSYVRQEGPTNVPNDTIKTIETLKTVKYIILREDDFHRTQSYVAKKFCIRLAKFRSLWKRFGKRRWPKRRLETLKKVIDCCTSSDAESSSMTFGYRNNILTVYREIDELTKPVSIALND